MPQNVMSDASSAPVSARRATAAGVARHARCLGVVFPEDPALDVCRMCQADVSSWQLSRRRALRAVSCEPVHAARGQRLVDCCLRVRGGIHTRDTHTRACSHAVPASWTPSRTEITIVKLLAAKNPNTVSRSISLYLADYCNGITARTAQIDGLCCCVVVLRALRSKYCLLCQVFTHF